MTGDSRTTTADKLVLDHLDRGEQLAVWQAGREGLAWMDRLVNDRRAIAVSDNGYPSIFVARAEDVVRTISSPGGPPKSQPKLGCGAERPDRLGMAGSYHDRQPGGGEVPAA
jgi:hypothetical protein